MGFLICDGDVVSCFFYYEQYAWLLDAGNLFYLPVSKNASF